jgi:DNA-binding transcriptional MerR regulator
LALFLQQRLTGIIELILEAWIHFAATVSLGKKDKFTGVSMFSTPQNMMKIGELYAQSGVPVKTIRYYEDIGLIQSHSRTDGGFRLFTPEILPRLAFIKRAQSLGFSLEEIQHILSIHDHGKLPCAEVRTQIQQKVEHIDHQIRQLQLLKSQLLSLVQKKQESVMQTEEIICPILQSDQLKRQQEEILPAEDRRLHLPQIQSP